MLNQQRLVAFVGVSSGAAAKALYQDSLGLRLVEENPFVLTFDANGSMLVAHIVPKVVPAGYTVLGWTVGDIRKEIADLAAAGIQVERYPRMEQDEFGVWTSPGGGAQVAWFKDPDGNTLSLSQTA